MRVGSRGTIVIPKQVRDKSGIVEGDVLEVFLKEKAIVLMKDTKWEKFHGCAEGLVTAEKIEKELDEDEKAWEKRLER
ncbi:MAG: AbrB/MazE/SpoVT family DNA-binding domain-containing protein [Candidatus Bathyarchaeia archaeon]|nr:AbrB/MazE/SpoVT family DNA-binding domain-containing protein [Candidatus Bathyarchaeia archaeon]